MEPLALYQELLFEFEELYPEQDFYYFDHVIETLAESFDPLESDTYQINITKEKVHALQENVFITITSDFGMDLSLEFENGINNGTRFNDYSFSQDLKPKSRTVEVLKDIEFDEERLLRLKPTASVYKARNNFNRVKKDILKNISEQNYDNYVTGGGTNITDRAYKAKQNEFEDTGAYYKCIYEEIEVDVNLK